MTATKVSQAIALVKEGKKDEARKLLTQVLKEDLHNETAWLWLAETMPDEAQRAATLERCLKSNPNSQAARKALEQLRARQSPPVAAPTSAETVKPLLQAIRTAPLPPSPIPRPPEKKKEPPAPQAEAAGKPKTPAPKTPHARPEETSQPAVQAAPPAKAKASRAPADEPPKVIQPPAAEPRPAEAASPNPPAQKGARLNALDIGAIVLIVLIVIGTAAYLLWERYGSSLNNLPFRETSTGMAMTAGFLDTKNAQLAAKLTDIASHPSPTPTQATPTSTPTMTPSPTATPIDLGLPGPVYFITGLLGGTTDSPATGSYQVWRLGADGVSLDQITDETSPVVALDVSSLDGSLAYVSDNQLIVTDADGKNRRILAGTPFPEGSTDNGWTTRVSSPLWSPDGRQIAFGLNGVNLLNLKANQTTSLIKNVQAPANKPEALRLYEPALWSPDGTRLLTRVGKTGCGSMVILTVATGKTTAEIDQPNDQFFWSPDSQTIFGADPVPGGSCGGNGGLWSIEAATGKATDLVVNPPDAANLELFGWPMLVPDGQLEYFFHAEAVADLTGQSFPHSLYKSAADGTTDRNALGSEQFYFFDVNEYQANGPAAFGSVLWAPDGSLAIVSAARQAGGPRQLWLLRSDGSPAVKITDQTGISLRWGVFLH